jgi:peptide/nickel transport system ATP-binding protein
LRARGAGAGGGVTDAVLAPAPRAEHLPVPPLVELVGVGRRFERAPPLWKRILGETRSRVVHALAEVDLRIARGEVVGLVGESGCGKSTLGRIVAGMDAPSDGDVLFEGRNAADLRGEQRRRFVRAVQMVFQDPFASLNPRMRIGMQVSEAPVGHGLVAAAEADAYAARMLTMVGLDPGMRHRYPHQFSGGQRQRIAIARALAVQPDLLVCDEAVASLDVSIQAQILNLFLDLREQLGLTYLFISHDLGVIQHVSDRIVVMYLGRVVESAPTATLFEQARHPYTRALLDEIPRLDGARRDFVPIKGELPSPLAPPPGCHFHPRCPLATARCKAEAPPLRRMGEGHLAACHLAEAA